MRCKACDHPLGSRESTRKALFTGDYIDLCDRCYDPIKDSCPTTDNPYHSGQIDTKEVEEQQGDQGEGEGFDAS